MTIEYGNDYVINPSPMSGGMSSDLSDDLLNFLIKGLESMVKRPIKSLTLFQVIYLNQVFNIIPVN